MKLRISMIKGSILILLLISLSGCQELADQFLPPETQQEIADEVQKQADKAIDQIGQEIKDEAGQILEGIKTEYESEIKSSNPLLYACSTSPSLCPAQTDKNMSNEWKQVTALYQNSPEDRNSLQERVAYEWFNLRDKD